MEAAKGARQVNHPDSSKTRDAVSDSISLWLHANPFRLLLGSAVVLILWALFVSDCFPLVLDVFLIGAYPVLTRWERYADQINARRGAEGPSRQGL